MRFMVAASCTAAMFGFAVLHPAWGDGTDLSLTEQKGNFVVGTGSGLTFTISTRNGDLTLITYNGRKCLAPFEKAQRYSHYASGLSGSSKITSEKGPDNEWVKITVDDSTIGVTQYYVARKGESNIYMATYAMKSPPPGEMRFIIYLNRDVFTNVPAPSNISLSDAVVEGKDVFRNTRTGTTYSKFYGSSPIIDGGVHGVSGDGIGCFMNMGNRETSSGGPFFRDIENQTTGGASEFYNYMFSGHTQTEPFRPGLKGPYALQFTDGRAPAPPDYSFLSSLDLEGYVPASRRGAVTGVARGVPAGHRATVALASSAAQYWANADAAGTFTIPNVLPGAYTEILYDTELAVAKKPVTVDAGTTAADIDATLFIPPAIFRIGTWDGTPREFLNAAKIADHHPSDACMTPFANGGNFVIGASKDSQWPLGEWMSVNDDQRITFNLTNEQARIPVTLRIGVTLTYNDGRPQIEVNPGSPNAWKSTVPETSNQPKQSRGITRGTYRGNNDLFSFDIPPGALHNGTNSIAIHTISRTKSYPGFLSPNIVFDAIDLVTTADARKAAASLPVQ